jgi:hypothetical protein
MMEQLLIYETVQLQPQRPQLSKQLMKHGIKYCTVDIKLQQRSRSNTVTFTSPMVL